MKNKKYILVKSFSELVFVTENIFPKIFSKKEEAQEIIDYVDNEEDIANSVDFLKHTYDDFYEIKKKWKEANKFKGYYNYDIVEVFD
jgi:hypothetical protein